MRYVVLNFGKMWVIVDTQNRNLFVRDDKNKVVYFTHKRMAEMRCEKMNQQEDKND